MSQKMYNIGEFASINKITARMLRHYDKIGLLKPDMVLENGYRAYSSEQILIAGLIKKYRDCEFSLSEIALLLNADEFKIKRLAEGKIQELKQRDSISMTILEQLYRLSGKETPILENHYELSFSERKEQAYFCLKESIAENKIEQAFDNLYHLLEQNSITQCGLYMLLSDFTESASYQVAIPIKKVTMLEGFQCESLEPGWYISTIHYGDYYNIAAAYDKLFSYLEEHDLKPQAPFIERYFLDSTHTANPSEYITEISIKITP